MAGFIIFGFTLLLLPGEINYDMYIILGILLGVWFLWSLVYYTQTRLRLREWYAQRDCDVFETEHDDKSSRGVAEKQGLVATRQQGKTSAVDRAQPEALRRAPEALQVLLRVGETRYSD